jgi:hypothetical protein
MKHDTVELRAWQTTLDKGEGKMNNPLAIWQARLRHVLPHNEKSNHQIKENLVGPKQQQKKIDLVLTK